MALLVSPAKLSQLYGNDLPIADVSGTVDGTSHMTLTVGDSLIANLIPYGKTEGGIVGNFVCKIGDKEIDKRLVKGIQTIGWMFPSGRMLSLGSLYKKNSKGDMNPANTNVPATTSKAEAIKALNGKKITVMAVEDIQVRVFNPGPKDPVEIPGRWATFQVSKKTVTPQLAKTEEDDED